MCLCACMLVCLGFIHTLEIISRILSEVVNRDRLCGTNAFCASFRNFWGCQTLFVCLFVCLFVVIKPEKLYSAAFSDRKSVVWKIPTTRSDWQIEFRAFDPHLLRRAFENPRFATQVTLAVNRERLCGTSAFYFGGFRNLWGCQTPCRSTDTI